MSISDIAAGPALRREERGLIALLRAFAGTTGPEIADAPGQAEVHA